MVVTGSAPHSWTDEHADSYSAQIAELGAALRRLEALHFQRAAEQHDGFEPIRITTTRPDGEENALVVGVAEKHAAAVEEAMNAAVNKLAGAIGSKHQAQAALLATLAGQIWGEGRSGAPQRDWQPSRIGANPPAPLVDLHQTASREVLAAVGVNPALFSAGDGTAAREAWRQLLFGGVAPSS